MTGPQTKKLDELFRTLPRISGVDPWLVESAKTEVDLLKFHAGSQVHNHKQENWTKNDLEKLQAELQSKDTEIYILKQQLLKAKENSASFDETPRHNTPMKLREKYTKLYDIEWNDAYDYFREKGWNEIETIVTLQRILRASQRFCQDVATEQLMNIEGEAIYPSASWMDDNGIVHRMKKDISREITNLAKTYQKSTGQRCLSALQKVFISHVLPTFIDPERYFEREINVYTKLCVEITWFMAIQDPPMVFIDIIDRGANFDTEYFQKYKHCTGNKFDYLVWPALVLFPGGPLVVKGVAMPIKKKHAIHDVDKRLSDEPKRKMKMPYGNIAATDYSPRNPETLVDLEMESDDDNSWERDDPPHIAPQEYPPTVRDRRVDPASPYFHSPEHETGIPAINIIEPTEGSSENMDTGLMSRRSVGRHKGATPRLVGKPDLTVQWKKKGRMPSAP